MPEAVLLVVGLALAGGVVLRPLRATRGGPAPADAEVEAAELRHRAALDALRDVEADRRAGWLDAGAYAGERGAAEERAAVTLAGLDLARKGPAAPAATADPRARRAAALVAAAIAALLLVGVAVPPPLGLANATRVDESRAAAEAAEAARQERIRELLAALDQDASYVEALSKLADEYLAGSSADDLARAAAALTLVIAQRPQDVDAHERIITAYLRAGDYANARAALDSLRSLDADPADVAFFEGIIALRGEDDPQAAAGAFDRFLELAPRDPRAAMVRALRAEATGE